MRISEILKGSAAKSSVQKVAAGFSLRSAQAQTEACGYPLRRSTTPRLDLELLLEKVLQKTRSFFFANSDYELTKEEHELLDVLYARRQQGEPIAYILGKKEFWSREFTVNNKVLIPRPETELLIEIILRDLKKESAHIADLGTGSGAIALTLASERPSWNVVATDICEDALQVASYNAMQLQVQNIGFYRGHWCEALPERKFDVIVSNPPYVRENDPCCYLSSSGLTRGSSIKPVAQQHLYEPKLALESGEDGFEAFKKIIEQAKDKLNSDGLLVLEHGYDQSEELQELLRQNGYQNIKVYKDLAGIDRAVVAKVSSCYAEFKE